MKIKKIIRQFILIAITIVLGLNLYTMMKKTSINETNSNIKGNYIKVDKNKIVVINDDTATFLNRTLTGYGKVKEISRYKGFPFQKLTSTKIYEVNHVDVKGLSGNDYYVIGIKSNIDNNKTTNLIKLSHVKSSVLKSLGGKVDKEITIDSNLPNLKKDTIITLSNNDTQISTNTNAKEKTIEYKVKDETYYKYTPKTSKQQIFEGALFITAYITSLLVIGAIGWALKL